MAEYTITLEQAKALMSNDQLSTYNALLASVVPEQYAADFAAAFEARYLRREISNGTPAGFLEDLTDAVYSNKLELTALWEQYDEAGPFGGIEKETISETPNITKRRTPDLTDARTPNLTRTDHVVVDDTPQTSGVIAGGYAANVTDGNQTETGSDTVRRTGTETETETGTRSKIRTRETDDDINEIIRRGVANLMLYTLRKFATCFMLLY